MPQSILAGQVVYGLAAPNKKALLQKMAKLAADALDNSEHVIFDALWEREKLGTTGVGHGIAIPHAKVGNVPEVRGFFAHLAEPVDYEAIDEKPVDLVFLLLAPQEAGADHLRALANISRLLRDPEFCIACRQAGSAAKLSQLLKDL